MQGATAGHGRRASANQAPMLAGSSRHEVSTMGNVCGTTGNGFTYEADYQPPSAGRVHWTATFRHKGDYAGMRHGCVHNLPDAPAAELDAAIRADIESTWTDAH
ncbi:hypothetical protein [Rhodanobacter sp. T12-5]|uniref:hypothetical protein n=1 Tax=Rhodanobacter sp. T12-5 TaxID=2024611 RepID=UPI001F5BB475|nr:hypothetical protein [Rhodanobacter sp. T12-5]